MTEIIRTFLGALDLIDYKNPDLIEHNPSVKFYWNDGKPYIADLVKYYQHSQKAWRNLGGETIDYLEEYWPAIQSCDLTLKAPWTKSHANIHKLLLLERNFFWYQRFLVDPPRSWRYRRLKNPNPYYNSGLPRKLKFKDVLNATYQVIKD